MGDFYMLKRFITVSKTETFLINKTRVSSSHIRKLLANGDIKGAEKMLGRKYQICGTVITGRKLGRTLGFPTANIAIKNPIFAPKRCICNYHYY